MDTNTISDIFTFYIQKIEGGIFQLISFVNKNEKVFGNARIDKMKTQRMVEKAFKVSSEKDKILIDCKYSLKFNKFIPIKPSDKYEPDQFIEVVKYVKSL